MKITVREVLVLDANTLVDEIGLTSRDGSALKHYLCSRGMQLFVPEVVAEECEKHLTRRALRKRKEIGDNLQWLARFCGEVSGWQGLDDKIIEACARALARPQHLDAVVVPETSEVRRRAELRNKAERPPSHKSAELADCRIWEQCLDLLAEYNVVFVSGDGDFCGHRKTNNLHPTLRTEAEKVAEDRLTFHRTVESLLSELRSDIQQIPSDVVFTFVYDSIASVIEELESNSGCHPQRVGEVKQKLFTTDQAEVIEIRLDVISQ